MINTIELPTEENKWKVLKPECVVVGSDRLKMISLQV
jgi:hypothetical protein